MKKRIFAVLLCVCLLVGLLPAAAFAAGADTGKAIQLGASQIAGGQASSVYFGNYQQSSDGNGGYNIDPIKWRALSNTDGKLFLLSDQNLDARRYNSSYGTITTWEKSPMRSWMNKDFLGAAFSKGEQAAIEETNVVNDDNPWYGTEGGNNTTDKIFLLSHDEACDTAYGFGSSYNTMGSDSGRISLNTDYNRIFKRAHRYSKGEGLWWLRTPGKEGSFVACVNYDGYIFQAGRSVDDDYVGIRPAFNLNLNSVLFTSAADNSGHIDFGTAIPGCSGSEWKVTLKDGNDFSSGATVSGTTSLMTGYSNATLTISHAALSSLSGDYTNVTASLTDADGKLLYYGSINSSTSETESTVTIPEGLTEGTYALSIYGEDWNGEKRTDCATGTPYTVTLTVDNTTPTLSDGTATRESETTATVKFTSDEAGTYYYAVVESGDAEPTIKTIEAGTACDTTGQTISLDDLTGAGAKDIYIVVKDAAGNVSDKLKITIPAYTEPSYSISTSPSRLSFQDQKEGYLGGEAWYVTVTNTGNQNVTVALPASTNYTITAQRGFTGGTADLAPGGTARFSVGPKTGLAAGSYDTTLTISGSNGASASMELYFTVTHNYGTDWKTDADKHWHECSCGARADEAEHEYDDEQDTTCNVCGYERTVAPTTYTLIVDLRGGNGSTVSGEYAEGAVVNIDAGTRSHYRFSDWTSSDGGSFADAFSASTTFTMPAADTRITANWQYDVGTGKAVQIGASQIKGGQASSVYFGNYQQSGDGSGGFNVDPVKWRVLSDADSKLLLLSDQNLDVQPYNTSDTSITWGTSTIRSWLNGYGASENGKGTDYNTDNFIDAAFSGGEQGAIAETYVYNATQSDGSSNPNPDYSTSGGNNTTDKIFSLSIEEASDSRYFPNGDSSRIAINNDYVASRNNSMSGAGAEDYWWLRSPGLSTEYAATVTDTGGFRNDGYKVDTTFVAVRPAFNLNLKAILFTSAADNSGHISFGTTIPDYSGSEWKVTVKDGNDFSGGASVSGATSLTEGYSDATLTISHAALSSLPGDYTNVTAALTDASGELLYYGSVNGDTSATESTVTIPAGLSEGTYTLSIYGEEWNGANGTDYATGTPYTVTLTVDAAPPTPSDSATLYGATLTLDGTIGVNFYVDMTDVEEAVRSSYNMKFTVNGEETDVPFDSTACRTFGDATCYRFTCPVAAKQMADTITASLYRENTLVKTATYSAKKYCDNTLGKTSTTGLPDLLKAMLNYGSAAQTYFGYNTGSPANANLTEDEKAAAAAVTAEQLASYASAHDGTLPEGLDISATLILDSSVTIRFYIAGTTDNYTFTVDGKEVTPTECTNRNGNHCIDVTNIGVRQLATAHTLAISDGTGEVYSVSCSALSYAYSMVNDAGRDANIQNVAKALYLYYDASTRYNNWMEN